MVALAQIWGTGLKAGARAVALLNRHFDEDPQFDNSSITLHWHHLGWEGEMPVSFRPNQRSPSDHFTRHALTAISAYFSSAFAWLSCTVS